MARVQPADAAWIFTGKQLIDETLRRQLFEIVQLLDVAIADLAAGAVTLPDQAGVVGLGVFHLGVHERRVPAPAVDAGDAHAALQKIERRLAPHAAAARNIIGLAEGRSGAGVDHDDVERRQRMPDALELGLDVLGGRDVAVGKMPEVELDRRIEAPFQRHLVDRGGALAAVHGRGEMIRRVEMGAAVRRQLDPFDRPAFAVGQFLDLQPREELADLLGGLLVIEILDARAVARRIGHHVVLQRDGNVDHRARHDLHLDSRRALKTWMPGTRPGMTP